MTSFGVALQKVQEEDMSRKKYDPEKIILTSEEQAIESRVDHSQLKPVSPSRQAELKAAARAKLRELKNARLNIRMTQGDVDAVRALAKREGIKYQALIASIIHKFVTDQLVDINAVRTLVDELRKRPA